MAAIEAIIKQRETPNPNDVKWLIERLRAATDYDKLACVAVERLERDGHVDFWPVSEGNAIGRVCEVRAERRQEAIAAVADALRKATHE